MALFLAACICLFTGFAALALCRFPRQLLGDDILLRVSLSVGYGLGIFSVLFYLSLLWSLGNLLVIDVAVLAMLITMRAVQLRLHQPTGFTVRPLPTTKNIELWPVWFQQTLTAAFAITFLTAAYSAVVRMQRFPHGNGWDAFAIWNLHARFLFLGGAHWRDGFTTLVGGSHPDYPLLLPAAIAHFWKVLGSDNSRIPAVIGIVFTFATVGVLFGALSALRGRMHAMMGAIALLATPFFIEQGTAQYADVPLSFFFLSTIVLLCFFDSEQEIERPGLLVLAGWAAGFAAWTKNEGLLFLLAIAASRVMVFIRTSKNVGDSGHQTQPTSWKAVFWLLIGLLPGLILVMYYKHSIGVPGDLFSDLATTFPKLLDPKRYWIIFAGYVKGAFRFGHWLWIPGTVLLAGLFLMFGRDIGRTRQPGFRTSVLALILILVGYFGVFLITPYDIHWHLRFSLVRLFLQLWPSTVFLSFLAIRTTSSRFEHGVWRSS